MSSRITLVGRTGQVSHDGTIRPGQLGEVDIPIRGGVETYLALDVDGGLIGPGEEIVVVEQTGPQSVLVTRLYEPTPTPES